MLSERLSTKITLLSESFQRAFGELSESLLLESLLSESLLSASFRIVFRELLESLLSESF